MIHFVANRALPDKVKDSALPTNERCFLLAGSSITNCQYPRNISIVLKT